MVLCPKIVEAFRDGTANPVEVGADLRARMHEELQGPLTLSRGIVLTVPQEEREGVVRATWPVLIKYCLERSARHTHRTWKQEMHDAMGNYYLTRR